ncbi:MAG: restriction endonuclease subunit S [Desulfuromonadales bacterium]|nr:restriction endonuclease subunit S [Desulfuromonadales bacterium]
MSKVTTTRPPEKRALGSMVVVDPESLPFGTKPDFAFHYIDISAATNGRLSIPDAPIEYRDAPSRARRVIKTGDVLMSTVRPNLKAFAYCDLPAGNYIASTGFAVLRALGETDSRYVLYAILSDDVSQQINSHTVGSNYPAINSSDVRRLKIPAFTPAEQRRIAEILSTLDEAIEQTEALIAKVQQIKAGLMHDLFTRGVTPDGRLRPTRVQAPELYKESPIGWIPKEWGVKPLDHHVRIVDCKHYTPEFQGEGYPFIRPRNVKVDGLEIDGVDYVSKEDFLSLTDVHRPRRGDIVFSRNASFGVPCYIDTDVQFAIGQDVVIMIEKGSETRFVFYALTTSTTSAQLAKVSAGSTFERINLKEIRKLLIHEPDIREQRRISTCLVACESQSQGLKSEVAKLRQQKAGLMHDLLTGHVRVGQSDTFLSKLSVGAQGG